MGFDPAKSAFTRVHWIRGRAGPTHASAYVSCLKMAGVTEGIGDITKIECPDPDRPGEFIETGEIRGARERPTTTLTGRYPSNRASEIKELVDLRCALDVHLNMGECKKLGIFTEFQKKLIWEAAEFTNYSTDDLGALSSDENAAVNEMVDMSAAKWYEVLPIAFTEEAKTIVTNELLDVVICGPASCGTCGAETDGCYHAYAVSKGAGGSAGTSPDIVFTVDKGANWYADDIDSLGAAEDADGVACLGKYVVVISADSNSLHYALKSEVDDVDFDETWVEVATGFVTGGEPNDISSTGSVAWIVGNDGYIYQCVDPTAGVVVIDAGETVTDHLLAVHALSATFIVAVGQNGAVAVSSDGALFAATDRPAGVGVNLNCVWCLDENTWFVGTSTGRLFYTIDGGDNWAEKAFPGSGSGIVHDIAFPTRSIGYMAHSTSAPAGRILRSYDGGYSWSIVPEATGKILPANDYVGAIATCQEDVNYIVGVGLADNGADGFVAVGKD